MAANDKVTINLLIGSQQHQISVPHDMEPYFRDAAKLINEKYNLYRQGYQNQSTDRYNAVVMLDIAVRYIQHKHDQNTLPFVRSMEQLTQEIEDILGEKKQEAE